MSLFEAAVLGAVQGLAEFLPISSSGHLILVRWLFGGSESAESLVFDTALHLGTLVALLAYFWREWLELARAVLAGLANPAARADPRWRLAWLLAIGSVPAGVVGLLFESAIERLVRHPAIVASLLIVFGLLLLTADRLGRHRRGLQDVRLPDALVVGVAQAIALLPGVSRSGITMTAALFLGLERAAAARFSFLLSSPIVLAAGLYELRKLVGPGIAPGQGPAFLVGAVTSAVVGFLAIGFLLRYLQRNSVASFVWYRLLAGAGVLVLLALGR